MRSAFFARPVGGIVFGHFGDRMGRKSMLVTTLMLMGMATFLIGVLPTYDQVGMLAPILLVVLRFVQGFGVGGEWGGAVLMVVEHGHAGPARPVRQLGAGRRAGRHGAGHRRSSTCSRCCPTKRFLAWGWRVPFLFGIALLCVGLFIRLQIVESPLVCRDARRERASTGVPFFEVLKRYPRNVLLAMGVRFAENGSFYIFTVFVLTYVTSQLQVPRASVLNGVLLASVAEFLVIPFYGLLSDRLGRRPVYLAGAIGLAAFSFPFFWMLDTGNAVLIGLAISIGLVVQSAMYAPQAAFFSELFGTEVRYTGASIGYHMASPFAGGLAPLSLHGITEVGRRTALADRPVHDRHVSHHARVGMAGGRNARAQLGEH